MQSGKVPSSQAAGPSVADLPATLPEAPAQPPALDLPQTPADPPLGATPAGDNPAGFGKQPDAVGRGDSSASSGSLADGPRGDAGAGSVGAGGAGCFRFVDGCLVAGG
jgi:hypothetical protein